MNPKADHSALLEVFARERKRLLGVLRRIVGSTATAEEVAHDAFLRLWERQRQGSVPEGDCTGLLYRTARNLALDRLRGLRVRERYVQVLASEEDEEESPSSERLVAAREQLESLMSVLGREPARTRQIFLLNRVDQLSYAQIAERLGLSVSLVEKEMMRALKVCRRWRESQ
ncbi:RNA polymerase sigma factor [Halotalea alkalilenta]|uniref:RNA polymerase sigma factor n=1 Tax=Halotalea alkalilenta TaxID=376489 RepID=UPI00048310AD|nr:sigma-70 family RNA polymerase sigma factor [Halotalea alkalilenta]